MFDSLHFPQTQKCLTKNCQKNPMRYTVTTVDKFLLRSCSMVAEVLSYIISSSYGKTCYGATGASQLVTDDHVQSRKQGGRCEHHGQ